MPRVGASAASNITKMRECTDRAKCTKFARKMPQPGSRGWDKLAPTILKKHDPSIAYTTKSLKKVYADCYNFYEEYRQAPLPDEAAVHSDDTFEVDDVENQGGAPQGPAPAEPFLGIDDASLEAILAEATQRDPRLTQGALNTFRFLFVPVIRHHHRQLVELVKSITIVVDKSPHPTEQAIIKDKKSLAAEALKYLVRPPPSLARFPSHAGIQSITAIQPLLLLHSIKHATAKPSNIHREFARSLVKHCPKEFQNQPDANAAMESAVLARLRSIRGNTVADFKSWYHVLIANVARDEGLNIQQVLTKYRKALLFAITVDKTVELPDLLDEDEAFDPAAEDLANIDTVKGLAKKVSNSQRTLFEGKLAILMNPAALDVVASNCQESDDDE